MSVLPATERFGSTQMIAMLALPADETNQKRGEIMLHKVQPDLTIYLAEEALKHRYDDSTSHLRELVEIQRECRDYLSTANIRKIYARMLKIEVAKMVVEAVWQSLTPAEQKFVELKYRRKKQLVAISLKLNISLSQLNIWQRAILVKVADFMMYRLGEEDVFERDKIARMVRLIGKILEFAKNCDPDREIMTASWLTTLEARHRKYFELLSEVDEILNRQEKTLHEKIIAAKLEAPQKKLETLARACNVDKSIVSRHLKKFVADVRKYLE